MFRSDMRDSKERVIRVTRLLQESLFLVSKACIRRGGCIGSEDTKELLVLSELLYQGGDLTARCLVVVMRGLSHANIV